MLVFEGASQEWIEGFKKILTKAVYGTDYEDAIILISPKNPKIHSISTDVYDKLRGKLEDG